MQISDKQVKEFQRIFKEDYGEDLSDQDAREAAGNLIGFFELLFEVWHRDQRRKQQLKESPNGFHLPEGEYYNCFICHETVSGETSWYNKHGITCLICKEALRKRVVPVSVMKKRDTWLAMWEVRDLLGVHVSTVKKMIRTGELKARIIKNGEHEYFWVFLKKENDCLQKLS